MDDLKLMCDLDSLKSKEFPVSDLRNYVKKIGRGNWKPEDCVRRENHEKYFKEALKSIGSVLDKDGRKHIILLDEVDLNHMEPRTSDKGASLEIDLSYLGSFKNVQFILCIRPAYKGLSNFKISCDILENQKHFKFKNVYRNASNIQLFIQYLIDNESNKGLCQVQCFGR